MKFPYDYLRDFSDRYTCEYDLTLAFHRFQRLGKTVTQSQYDVFVAREESRIMKSTLRRERHRIRRIIKAQNNQRSVCDDLAHIAMYGLVAFAGWYSYHYSGW